MRRVGEVVRVAQGRAIVRSPDETYPEIGAVLLDERLDRIGRVVDVIGPTTRPFVVVDPDEDRPPESLLNARLYRR